MKNNIELSDELIVKFINEQTTAEETEQVLAYFSENDAREEDFINICAAIELQRKVEIEQAKKDKKRIIIKKHVWIFSAVAAVILLLVVSLFILPNEQKPQLADQTTDKKVTTPSTAPKTTPSSSEDECLTFKLQNPDASQQATPEQPNSNQEQIAQIQSPKTYAATETRTNFCTMIMPRRDKHTIKCSDLDEFFEFRWDSDANNEILTLKDKNGKVICKKELHGTNPFKLKLLDYYKYETIIWELQLQYPNGTSEKRTGTLLFEISEDGTWYLDRNNDDDNKL